MFYNEETGKITVYSGNLTPEELRRRINIIKENIKNGKRESKEPDTKETGPILEGNRTETSREEREDTENDRERKGGNKPERDESDPDGIGERIRATEEEWYDLASAAHMGAFVSEEQIAEVKRYMQEGRGIFFDPESGFIYTADRIPIEDIKDFYDNLKKEYDRAKKEAETADDIQRRGEARADGARVDETEGRKGVQEGNGGRGDGDNKPERDESDPDGIGERIRATEEEREVDTPDGKRYESDYLVDGEHKVTKVDEPNKKGDYTGSYYEYNGKRYADFNEIVKEIDKKSDRPETDEYLQPRNDKEKKIISDVEKKLAEEIKEAEDKVRKANGELEKARAKESDKATDLFSDDNAFKEEGQLFGSEEMPTDRTQEGVNKRTEEQRGELADAEKELERLKSKAEHDSRVRGALDNERRQTSFDPLETAEEIANEERLRINNNSQSSLMNNLESDVSESKSVPLSKRPLRTFTDYNGNIHEGLEEELQSLQSRGRGRERGASEGTGEPSEGVASRPSTGVVERYARITELRDEIERRKKIRGELRKKYNIDEKGNISLDDVTRLFRDLNTSKELGELFDKVFSVLKTISPEFRFTDKFNGGESGSSFRELSFYDWDTIVRSSNDYIANVLLHEMIHNVSSYILNCYEDPTMGSLTREQKRIAKEIKDIVLITTHNDYYQTA